ncbi:hypothetical protein BQ8794_140139 [Mesorhizobium prunaredense]|uniref:Uncharacterized protein n=1 Tax=Mesorhizobium prunaredense TaxID=1631249 RepID=A0A1R3V271_9HYPH|nr:hypothetical protein BQ8794_140139 [Mesorhizobium prunaredense]
MPSALLLIGHPKFLIQCGEYDFALSEKDRDDPQSNGAFRCRGFFSSSLACSRSAGRSASNTLTAFRSRFRPS